LYSTGSGTFSVLAGASRPNSALRNDITGLRAFSWGQRGGYSHSTIPKSVEAAAATFLAIRSHSIDNALSLLPSPRRRACL
jgi:hypothetical protein